MLHPLGTCLDKPTRTGPSGRTDGPHMKNFTQLAPVAFGGLLPALVYTVVASVSRVTGSELRFMWAALVVAAIVAWCGIDDYLAQRDVTVAAMKRFGQAFVREFERPLREPDRQERPLQWQLRASPDRGRLEILLAPCGRRRYPNLSDHKTNVAYDVARVLAAIRDERFVCEASYSMGSWVVLPFRYHAGTKQAGGR